MSGIDQMALAWQALRITLRGLRHGALWVPWLLLAGLQFGWVTLLWWAAHPLVSWFMAPLLTSLVGPDVLRYPNPFRMMPGLYARADVVLGALVGSVMAGASTVLFAARFRGANPQPLAALAAAARRSLTLILVNLPFNLLVVVLSYGLEWWVADRESSLLVRRLAHASVVGGAVLLQAFFLYVNPLVMVDGCGVLATIRGLPGTWARGFWAAVLLGALMVLPLIPLDLLTSRSGGIVDRGVPELVGWLTLAQAALGLFSAFVLTGAATLVHLSTSAEASQERAA